MIQRELIIWGKERLISWSCEILWSNPSNFAYYQPLKNFQISPSKVVILHTHLINFWLSAGQVHPHCVWVIRIFVLSSCEIPCVRPPLRMDDPHCGWMLHMKFTKCWVRVDSSALSLTASALVSGKSASAECGWTHPHSSHCVRIRLGKILLRGLKSTKLIMRLGWSAVRVDRSALGGIFIIFHHFPRWKANWPQ